MKATLAGQVVADSDDVVKDDEYIYFSAGAVRLDRLVRAARTESDRACPHGVQFYDAVVDGTRYPRVAWCYEAPKPKMAHVAGRFAFWQDVKVG